MKIVTTVLVNAFTNRMMNIHPSLLPSFPGLDVQKKAIEWGCKLAGCTVHFVTEGVDEGPIIIQAAVPILDNDTSESLASQNSHPGTQDLPSCRTVFRRRSVTS